MGVLPLHSRGCCARHASNRGSVQQRMSTFKGEERRIHTSLVLIKQKTCTQVSGFIACLMGSSHARRTMISSMKSSISPDSMLISSMISTSVFVIRSFGSFPQHFPKSHSSVWGEQRGREASE